MRRRSMLASVGFFSILAGCRAPAASDASEPPAELSVERAPEEMPITWRSFGSSVEGRELRSAFVGRGERTVIWIGGIHGDETEGVVASNELAAAFAAEPELAETLTLAIVEDVNPDGRAAGTRQNARGVDLNRDWPARNWRAGPGRGASPLSQPETRALHALFAELDPELVVVSHSSGARAGAAPAFVNYDGPADELARAFSEASGYPVVPSEVMHATPGSLGSFLGVDRGIATLTIEYARGRDPRVCWDESRCAILAALHELARAP